MTTHTTPSNRTLRRSAGALATVLVTAVAIGSAPPAQATTTGGSPLDTTAPQVVAHQPGTGAEVEVNARPTARASEALRASSVGPRTVRLVRRSTGERVAASVRYVAQEHRLRLFPFHPLEHGTAYRVVVTTGVRDAAGNRLDQSATRAGRQPASWIFRTR